MNKLIETETALREYASRKGWPSQKEWTAYAKEHDLLGWQGANYRTGMNWETYRKHLGFPTRSHHHTYKECIDAIKEASENLGQFFTRKEYEAWQSSRPDLPTHHVISRRCGGWNGAKVEADLLPNLVWGKEFTDDEIISALKACANSLGTLFSEDEYLKWRGNNPDLPHVETIRKRLGGMPEAKKKMGLESYQPGPNPVYSDGRWKEPYMNFLRDQLKHSSYEEWLKNNDGPSLDAIWKHAGGYEKALIESLQLYIEKIKAGRIKR